MISCFFRAFPHLRGDWTPEGFPAEDAAAAAAFTTTLNPVPADLDATSMLPPNLAAAGTTPGTGGKRGLAYVPGYELGRWCHAPGWPPYYPAQPAALEWTVPAETAARAWLTSQEAGLHAAPSAAMADWPTYQKLHFLDTLRDAAAKTEPAGSGAWCDALDDAYGFGTSQNAEIRLRFGQLVATLSMPSPRSLASIEQFLHMIGKQKYQLPTYTALIGGSEATRTLAVRVFAATKRQLFVAVREKIAKKLQDAGLPSA
jgi:hypothetical protein